MFSDLERPLTEISRSLNISETVQDTDIFTIEY